MRFNYKKMISPVCVVLIWEFIGRVIWVDPFFFPPPTEMLEELYAMTISGEVFPHIGVSVIRALSGYLLAALVGLTLGLLVAWSTIVENIADPLIELIRPISTFALVPVMFVAWALVYPHEALRLIAALKRRIKGYVVRRASQRSAKKLAEQFRTQALSEGCTPQMIEDILAEHLPKIARRLESKWSNEYLG